ncbi:MAG: hypothetical protein ACYS8W_19055 [Planctomycetota bacterium]|jgi:hypothetical protein
MSSQEKNGNEANGNGDLDDKKHPANLFPGLRRLPKKKRMREFDRETEPKKPLEREEPRRIEQESKEPQHKEPERKEPERKEPERKEPERKDPGRKLEIIRDTPKRRRSQAFEPEPEKEESQKEPPRRASKTFGPIRRGLTISLPKVPITGEVKFNYKCTCGVPHDVELPLEDVLEKNLFCDHCGRKYTLNVKVNIEGE